MSRRRDGGSRMSEAGRTAAARLVHLWQGLGRERECPGRVLVHLDGAVTCSGKCEDVKEVYHAARLTPCRGKRGPASGTCARCTGRPELDLSSLAGKAMSLMRMCDGLRQMLTAARPPGSAISGVHHAAPAASAELAGGRPPATELDAELCELAQKDARPRATIWHAGHSDASNTGDPFRNYQTSHLTHLPIPRRDAPGC